MDDLQMLPQFVRDLLAEVSLMDEEAFPPTIEMDSDERYLGTVPEGWTRKLFATCTMHKRESERALVECKFAVHTAGGNCEHAASVNVHKYRADVCGKLFWTITNEHFHVWGEGGTLSLRKGWKIVVESEDDEDGPQFGMIDDMPEEIRDALIRRLKKRKK